MKGGVQVFGNYIGGGQFTPFSNKITSHSCTGDIYGKFVIVNLNFNVNTDVLNGERMFVSNLPAPKRDSFGVVQSASNPANISTFTVTNYNGYASILCSGRANSSDYYLGSVAYMIS